MLKRRPHLETSPNQTYTRKLDVEENKQPPPEAPPPLVTRSAISFNALMYSCMHVDVHVQYICAHMD